MTSPSDSSAKPSIDWRLALVIGAGCLLSVVAYGPRSTMGFFLTPMTREYGWGRETFALAIAVQNLVWGIAQPFAGMVADRYGTGRVLIAGAAVYAVGLVLMAFSGTPAALQLTAGLLIGVGVACTSFGLVLSAFARLLPSAMRPLAYGLGTAASSLGQFVFAPIGQGFIQHFGWQGALIGMALLCLLMLPLAPALRGKPDRQPTAGRADQSLREALAEAFRHRSYLLLNLGFFVCGFQIAFVTTHLPPFITDIGLPASWGAASLALIGLFNIAGSLSSGVLSGRLPKPQVLSAIYFTRALVVAVFIMTPPSVPSLLVFSALLGFLWLSTIPPTQGLVGAMFGIRYVTTLFGFVFLSHQVGAFLAVWLGGLLYDQTGSYYPVWWLSVALGIMAGIVHLLISEKPVPRPAPVVG